MANLVPVFVLAAALVTCFAGYRLFGVVWGLMGFVLGGWICGMLAWSQVPDQKIWVVGAVVVGGLLCAFALRTAYKVGVFFVGFVFGCGLGTVGGGQFVGPELVPIFGLAAGVVGGLLALWFQKAMIIVSTACLGAGSAIVHGWMILDAINPLRWLDDPLEVVQIVERSVAMQLGTLVLAVVGIFVQFRGRLPSAVSSR